MSKTDQIKIPVTIDTAGNMYMDELLAMLNGPSQPEKRLTCRLVRQDGVTKHGNEAGFIEWHTPELGSKFKQLHDTPQIGFSCILDPRRMQYTWLTSAIIEIQSDEVTDGVRCVSFRTKNSSYKLYMETDELRPSNA